MENLNSVCFIAKIYEIKRIDGADNIELALLNGWNCIISKNTYQVGDLVACAITDAIIPYEVSEKLSITNYLRNGCRVKTVKLKGVYSECLIIPLDAYTSKNIFEGKDMMSILNIVKYEPPVKTNLNLRVEKYHQNPNFPIYYKFPNLKNIPYLFNENDHVEITRKIHGTNARYGIVKKNKLSIWNKIKSFLGFDLGWSNFEFIVGSHNVEKMPNSQGYYSDNVWHEIAKKYNIKNELWDLVKNKFIYENPLCSGIVIYGEIYGKGIQKNYDYNLDEIKFCVFDIEFEKEYLNLNFARKLTEDILDLPYVEVLYDGLYSEEIKNKFVFNNFIENTKVPHEGIVIKHIDGNRAKVAKVINPEYLIYSEKNNVEDSH